MIQSSDYCALDLLSMFGRSYEKQGLAFSIDRRVSSIYLHYRGHRDDAKVYLLSKTIAQRVSKMDISALTADSILSISRSHAGEVGTILDPKGQPTKVSLNYVILPDLIIMDVFEGAFSKREATFRESEKANDAYFEKHFDGAVVVSPSGIEYTPNSAIQCINSYAKGWKDNRLMKEYAVGINKVISDLKKLPDSLDTTKITIQEICEKFPRETETLKAYDLCHRMKETALRYALRMFLYVHTSQTIKAEYIADGIQSQDKGKGLSCVPRGYIQVDALWDMEIDVINPFAVSGHFTHQPYGKNSSLRKLIYIEEYMKKGYHRRATKDIINEKQE